MQNEQALAAARMEAIAIFGEATVCSLRLHRPVPDKDSVLRLTNLRINGIPLMDSPFVRVTAMGTASFDGGPLVVSLHGVAPGEWHSGLLPFGAKFSELLVEVLL